MYNKTPNTTCKFPGPGSACAHHLDLAAVIGTVRYYDTANVCIHFACMIKQYEENVRHKPRSAKCVAEGVPRDNVGVLRSYMEHVVGGGRGPA